MRKLFTVTIEVGREDYFRMVSLVEKYNVRNSTEILLKEDDNSEITFKINKKNLGKLEHDINLLQDFGIQTMITIVIE